MYLFPSTSVTEEPLPDIIKGGVMGIPGKALTGEFTPPGIIFCAF
jgi:hypothetical protein